MANDVIPPEALSKAALRQRLIDAIVCCRDCGLKWGEPAFGAHSSHKGICHVCGEDAWVSDTRDYRYFRSTLASLTK